MFLPRPHGIRHKALDRLAQHELFGCVGKTNLEAGWEGDGKLDQRMIEKRQPAVRLCGAWSGGTPSPADDRETIDRITSSGASILLVGYGAPAQVLWIERNRHELQAAGIRVAVGVGGVIDYLSGHASTAPAIIRSVGLEWLYRLWHEPWRWRRQTQLVLFAVMVLFETARKEPCRMLSRVRHGAAGRIESID